jgi:hypothetical protein
MILRKNSRKKFAGLFAMLAIILAMTVTTPGTAAAPEASEQIVFSGTGINNFGAPFAFWIWCAAEGHGPYAEQHLCRGAVSIPVQSVTVGVNGFVVEEADETYTMYVESNHPGDLSAVLHNVDPEPVNGPNNTVEFTVVTPARTFDGISTSSVVHVTGPGD